MGMSKCGDCLYFGMCSHYVDAEETFPEVGGCHVFKRKDAFVEVVRCKDCKYRYTAKSGFILCTQHITMTPKDDDFCSYGERKDNERKAD